MPDPDPPAVPRPPAVGLVLGAGGAPGHAFHVGVLAALADHTGWDARRAELVVGTSAGAGVASYLRAGLSPADAYATLLGRPPSPEGRRLLDRSDAAVPGAVGAVPRHRGPNSVGLAVRGVLRWPPRPGLTVAGALPRGRHRAATMGARHRALHPDWPEARLWLCAVRARDGRRVVFGRDDHPPVDVGTAVEASSAVPGWFAPVAVGSDTYVDGAVWSTTNADLVTGLGFDAVVVVAPLSTPHRPSHLPRLAARATTLAEPARAAGRAYHRLVLEAETRRIRQDGTPVLAVEPTHDDLALLTSAGRSDDTRRTIAESAYASTVARLEADRSLGAVLVDPVTA